MLRADVSENCHFKVNEYTIELDKIPTQTAVDGTTAEYYYNPCVSFTNGTCKDVAICQNNYQKGEYTVGVLPPTEHKYDQTMKSLNITYNTPTQNGCARVGKVSVYCANSTKFAFINEDPKCTYYFRLETSYGCLPPAVQSGISIGGILLIIFFLIVLFYLIGGFLFMRYYYGERGIEQIPNLQFWREFPGLVKDGFLFTVGLCRKDSTYDAI